MKRDNLIARARILDAVRQLFRDRGFIEVETPLVVPSPGMDLHLDAFEVHGHLAKKRPLFLNTSPEYHMKRLLAEGLPRIFQITKAFRDDELGDLHNPEFTMLEWYRTPASMNDVMADTEVLVERVTEGEIRLDGARIGTRGPYPQLRVVEAFARYAGLTDDETLRLAREDETSFYRILIEKVEPSLRGFSTPVFLTHYPKEQASLAKLAEDDPRVAERFELYCAGVELCNGFSELVDPHEQRARFLLDQEARRRQGKAVHPIDERLLEALGKLDPSAGNALGLDRLVALAQSRRSIREVLAFDFDNA